MSGMIQNFNQSISSVNNTTKKYYNDFSDVNSDSLMKPLDGKGYLVENNLLTMPKEFAKDTYYTAKSLKKGIAGKANDHELGKLNDLGLKVGGLAIATYLMTKRSTPKTKAMEFIGFGAFLASMALWPKVALQWPAQLIHGFNFRKQYVDEQGRKKFLTQDPNYIAFDLLKGKKKSENLASIGDRMGISRDEKDRDEITKEQIRKISVQNNTMWMLTAGPATPIMTALACNVLEKPVGRLAEKYSNNKTNKLAEDINTYMTTGNEKLEEKLVKNKIDKASEKKLESILERTKGQPVSEKDLREISEALTEGLDTKTQKIAHRDLSYMMATDHTVVNNDTIASITHNLTEKLDSQYGEGYTSSVIDSEKIGEHINKFMETNGNPKNGVLSPEKSEELRLSLGELIETTTEGNNSIRPARKEIINSIASETIEEVFGQNKAAVMTDEAAGNISKAGQILRKYRAFDETLTDAIHFKVENASETIAANNWNDVSNVLVKHLNISPKELEEAKSSEELTAQLFTRKLEAIAQNKEQYKNLVSAIADKMLEFDTKLDNPGQGKPPVMDILVNGVTSNCEKTASELNNVAGGGSKPFFNLANRFSGEVINDVNIGSIKESKLKRIKQARVGSIQSSYYRLLSTLDFFKRAQENLPLTGDAAFDKELYAQGKKMLMSGHSGDFYEKNRTKNNPKFYHELMHHTFGTSVMSKDTEEVLSNKTGHEVFTGDQKTSMAQRFKNWSYRIKDLFGTTKADFMPYHITGNEVAKDAEKTASAKFNKLACAPENLLYNALKQKYNSNKWMKIFGISGAILLGGTIASQFAFGHKDSTIKKA